MSFVSGASWPLFMGKDAHATVIDAGIPQRGHFLSQLP
jgi:hypothetical protein